MSDVVVGNKEITVSATATRTVGEALDVRIKHARQQVEALCITKAKAEALGILDYPQEFVEQLTYTLF